MVSFDFVAVKRWVVLLHPRPNKSEGFLPKNLQQGR